MKKVLAILAAASLAVVASAQGHNHGDGGHDAQIKSLYEKVTNLEKKSDAFNVFFNYAYSYQLGDATGDWRSSFKNKQFRLEVKGTFGDHLSYRLRHRMNRNNTARGEDNFAKATDIMMLGWKFNDKWAVNIGKMCQIWGGFEFDENPMYIYQYSDFIDYMDNFMAGAMVSWHPVPSQELAFMVSNCYNGSFSEEFPYNQLHDGTYLKAAKHPLTYILNWNGSLFDGLLTTRWSVGRQVQAEGYYSDMVVLGQQLNLPKFQWYVDYMAEWDGVDRLTIASGDLGQLASDVRYHSFITKANWQFAPKWNLMGKAMYELASIHSVEDFKNYRTSIGGVASLEYYPWKDQDLRFFIAYVGRKHQYTAATGLENTFTNRIELGFMYRIKAY